MLDDLDECDMHLSSENIRQAVLDYSNNGELDFSDNGLLNLMS